MGADPGTGRLSEFTFIRSASREQIEAASLAVCVITRAEVERGLVGAVVDRLMMLTDEDAPALQLEGNLMLVFDGYDGDPRELYEMPDVRAFVRVVTDAWPFWFHFLDRTSSGPAVLLSLLVDHHGHVRADGCATLRLDAPMLHRECRRMFAAMDTLQRRLDLSPEHRREAKADLMRLLLAAGLTPQGGP